MMMAEKISNGIIKNGESYFPYWGKPFTTITGLDPLGLQTASEKIYSFLLPGITNLTNRIRYYGFYSWLLYKYIELYDGKITQQSQRRFIRRSELLIALIMMKSNPDASQITGSNKARELINKLTLEGSILLSKYADDRLSESAYWKYATGAFGQYYSASIRQIGLIRDDMVSNNHHVFMITEEGDFITGKKLAKAFSTNLNKNNEELFINAVEKGEVTLEQCKELYNSFSMTAIPLNSMEVDNYLSILFKSDFPKNHKISTSYRSETLSSLIEHIGSSKKGSNSEEYLSHAFQKYSKEREDPSDIRYFWYLYRVNEYWQYALGTIFWGCMNVLKKSGGVLLKTDLVNLVIEIISKSVVFQSGKSTQQHIIRPENDTLRKLSGEISNAVNIDDSDEALTLAFELLVSLLGINSDKIECDFEIILKHGLAHQECFWMDFIRMKKFNDLNKNIESFLEDFISRYILNRHKHVALRKIGNGSRSSIKFSEESGIYYFKGNFSPSFTNPRIGTALTILQDLGKIQQVGDFYHMVS